MTKPRTSAVAKPDSHVDPASFAPILAAASDGDAASIGWLLGRKWPHCLPDGRRLLLIDDRRIPGKRRFSVVFEDVVFPLAA